MKEKNMSVLPKIFGCMFLVAFISGVTMFLYALSSYSNEDEQVEIFSHSFNIYALEDNHLYIYSRYSTDNVEKYHFMRKINGGYKKGHIPSSNSYIYETNGQPKIEVYHLKSEKEWVNKIYSFGDEDSYETLYKIYIPKNSVITDFNIDLQ